MLATGGRHWEAARQYARHDSLSLELALRAAEYLPEVVAVAGEKLTTVSEVLFESWGKQWPFGESAGSIADLMLVRGDELRILVEMSAPGASEHDRAVRYARALAQGSTETQGSLVVFLAAGKPEFFDRAAHATKQLKSAVMRATRVHPGQPGARTADRLLIADWSEWFPLPTAPPTPSWSSRLAHARERRGALAPRVDPPRRAGRSRRRRLTTRTAGCATRRCSKRSTSTRTTTCASGTALHTTD